MKIFVILSILCFALLINISNCYDDHKFATGLYKEMIKDEAKSIIFSPMSVQTALTLVMFGATGDTKQELKVGMHYGSSTDQEIQEKYKSSSASIKSTDGLKIANKVYVANGHSIKPSFNQIAVKGFSSEAQNVDFIKSQETAATINKWVEDQTNNKIKDLIDSSSLDSDTRMILVNAIYFKGIWSKKFKNHRTTKKQFSLKEGKSVEVDMMSIKDVYSYGENVALDAKVLEMPYKNSDITMMIILPNKKEGLSTLESKIDQTNFQELSKSLESFPVNVEIPKFKIEFNIDMNKPLKKLGMNKMFSPAAEFSELLDSNERLYVSKVVHKAYIEVNEEGTEAAAATGVQMQLYSSISYSGKIQNFIADHPFMFVLKSSTETLFMGRFFGK